MAKSTLNHHGNSVATPVCILFSKFQNSTSHPKSLLLGRPRRQLVRLFRKTNSAISCGDRLRPTLQWQSKRQQESYTLLTPARVANAKQRRFTITSIKRRLSNSKTPVSRRFEKRKTASEEVLRIYFPNKSVLIRGGERKTPAMRNDRGVIEKNEKIRR